MLVSDNPLPGLSDLLEDFLFEGVKSQKASKIINFAAIDDDNRVARLVFLVYWHFRDLSYDFHAIDNLSEDHMLSIQMRTCLKRYEKLRGIRITSAISHRKQSRAGMCPREILIDKSASIDGIASLAARVGDVAALEHEAVDNAVEFSIEIVQFEVVGFAVLPRAEATEVLGGFGSEVVEKLVDYSACPRGSDLHVHVHPVVRPGTHFIIDYNSEQAG